MKKALLCLFFAFSLIGLSAQTVSVTTPCFGGTFVFTLNTAASPDASGRNVYSNNVLQVDIRFNTGSNRWEMVAQSPGVDVFYINTFISSPNPPDNTTSVWEDFGPCDGIGDASDVSGDGTQSDAGGDPCAALNGDTDSDGVCNDNDVCPGFDDNIDTDNDNIPDGCDASPTVPDGVILTATCLDPNPILFVANGNDGNGRNIYSNNLTQLDIKYNPTLGRWEVVAQSPGTDVFFYNDFASLPDPPDDNTGQWIGTNAVAACDGVMDASVEGSGTQNTLGCTISISNISVTDASCNVDGSISVTASGAFGTITYSISGAATASNTTGVFNNLPDGNYTITASDGAFPAGVCEDSDSRTLALLPDTEDPVISCPANITVNNDPGQCSAVVNYTAPVGTDNCPNPITALTAGLGSGAAFPVGVTTVTYQVTDGANRTASCSFTVTVLDMEDPVISCPANITVNNDAGLCSAVVTYAAPVGTDNCPGATTAQTAGLGSGAAFPVGVTTETYQITDAAGHTTSCSFTVTVLDMEDPVISCPANIIINNDLGLCSAVVNYAAPVGTDNCPGATTAQTAGLGSGATFPVGVTTETYQVTDAAGQTASCSFTVTVLDMEDPVISCPANITVNNDPGLCSAIVTYTAPVGTDNCPGATTAQTAGLGSGATFPVGVTTETYQVTDAAGRTASCSFTITVNDTEAPVVSCQDFSADLDANGEWEITLSYVLNNAFTSRTDNCGIDNGSVGFTAPGTYTCDNVGENSITITSLDLAGNPTPCTVTLTINDPLGVCNQPPVAICKNITVSADANCQASIVATDVDDGSTDPDSDPLTFSLDNSGPFGLGPNSVELTVSDGSLTDKCTAIVTVIDDTPPTITCPLDVTLSAEINCKNTVPDLTGGATVSDNCSATGGISLTQSPAAGTPIGLGTTTVTLIAEDEAGNTASCLVDVTVIDTDPAIAKCQPATIILNEAGIAILTPADIDGGSSDNCSAVSLSIDIESFDCYDLGDHVVTLTAADNLGQSTSCTATVTVKGPDADCDKVADLCDLCPGGDDKVDNDHDGFADCAYFPGLENLIDEWVCGKKSDKVLICHIPPGKPSKRKTLCVSPNAVADHLAHGDFIGGCNNAPCKPAASFPTRLPFDVSFQNFIIFPNPASQEVRFDLSLLNEVDGESQLSVYNNFGQLVYWEELIPDQIGMHRMDISQFSPGIYYVHLQADGQSIAAAKFIVSK